MIAKTVILDSLVFAGIANLYLLILMTTTSPRVWGYSDYPDVVKSKVDPPTSREKRTALWAGVPWFVFVLAYPIFACSRLYSGIGDDFSFSVAFIHIFAMLQLASLVDLLLLDWLIVSRITPTFVVIPGSDPADYKDFSHHFRAHGRAAVVITLVSAVFAAIVSFVVP